MSPSTNDNFCLFRLLKKISANLRIFSPFFHVVIFKKKWPFINMFVSFLKMEILNLVNGRKIFIFRNKKKLKFSRMLIQLVFEF
jgi:hypothetical protein